MLLLLTFSVVAIVSVARGWGVPCSCFGATSSAPLSWRTMVRNVIFALLLAPLILASRPSPMSIDAVLTGATNRSLPYVVIILSLPACLTGLVVLILTAEHTLDRISEH